MRKPKANSPIFFPDVIYRADIGLEGQVTYDSLEDMRDSHDVPDGATVSVYRRAEIKTVRFGQVTLEALKP